MASQINHNNQRIKDYKIQMVGIRIYLQHIISLIFQTNSPIMEWNDDSALPAAAAEPPPQVDVSVTFYRIHIMNVVSQRNHVFFFSCSVLSGQTILRVIRFMLVLTVSRR